MFMVEQSAKKYYLNIILILEIKKMAVLPLREMFKMRSLELKTLQIKDDLPLYVTL